MTIAIPITSRHDFLSFLYPLTFEVWMVIIVSVPTFILASMLRDYLYTRYRPFRTLSLLSEWQRSIAFIMRTIFVDNSFMYVKYEHKRICTCHHMAFVSICTHTSICRNVDSNDYKTRASEDNSNEDLLNQNDLSWVMEDGLGVGEYMKASPPGSTLRQLVKRASFLSYEEEWYGACQTVKTWKSKKFASICDIYSITDLISNDYRWGIGSEFPTSTLCLRAWSMFS